MESKLYDHLVTADQLQNLPAPVLRYLAFTGVIGHSWINTVQVTQSGKFRQSLDQPWMPVEAVQTFTTVPPVFVWKARFKMAGLPLMYAHDSYQNGHGHMFGKLAGLITLFDARGAEMDQGTLVRYLGEMIWFPTAFLGPNITWQLLDDRSAQVSLTDNDRTVTATMTFDGQGRPVMLETMRYREEKGIYYLNPWSVPMMEYANFEGLNLPVRGIVTWNLPGGDLPYFEWLITGVEYNREGGKNA